MTARAWTYRQLDPSAWPHTGLSPVNKLLTTAILLATGLAVLETEPLLSLPNARLFERLELGFGILFVLEYAARFWSAGERPNMPAWRARWHFARSAASLLDLVVLVGTLAPVLGHTLLPLRLVRLFRLLRLAKLGRTSAALRHLIWAVSSRRHELALTAGLAICVLLVGSTVLHLLEGKVQPEVFGSIPRALWWGVVTLTTIGYGDAYPITAAGKFAASLVAFAGIGLIAMPTGILAAAFSEAYRRESADPSATDR